MLLKRPSSSQSFIFFCHILFLTVYVMVFYPVLNGQMFWDDIPNIFKNPAVISPDFSVWEFWSRDSHFRRAWPLSYTFIKTLYIFFEQDLFGYKLVSLFLHLLNGILFYKITHFFSKNINIATITTYLTLLAPIQVETLSWILNLNILLSSFFFFIAFLIYISSENKKKYIFSLIFYALSLLAKPIAFPIFIFYSKFNKKEFLYYLLFGVLILTSFILTRKGISFSPYELTSEQSNYYFQTFKLGFPKGFLFHVEAKAISFFNNLHFYLVKSLIPFDFHLFYPKHSGVNLIAIITWSIMIGVYLKFKSSFIRPSLLGLIALFLPVSGIFYIPHMKFSMVANRWSYLITFQGFLIISLILAEVLTKFRTLSLKRILLCFAISLLVIFCYQSRNYARIYSSPKKLIKRNLEILPNLNVLKKLEKAY